MMDEVDDVLLDIAVRTTDSRERTKYFNVMHEVRMKRYKVEKNVVFIWCYNSNSTYKDIKLKGKLYTRKNIL